MGRYTFSSGFSVPNFLFIVSFKFKIFLNLKIEKRLQVLFFFKKKKKLNPKIYIV